MGPSFAWQNVEEILKSAERQGPNVYLVIGVVIFVALVLLFAGRFFMAHIAAEAKDNREFRLKHMERVDKQVEAMGDLVQASRAQTTAMQQQAGAMQQQATAMQIQTETMGHVKEGLKDLKDEIRADRRER